MLNSPNFFLNMHCPKVFLFSENTASTPSSGKPNELGTNAANIEASEAISTLASLCILQLGQTTFSSAAISEQVLILIMIIIIINKLI